MREARWQLRTAHKQTRITVSRHSLFMLWVLLLAACAGGGGSSAPIAPVALVIRSPAPTVTPNPYPAPQMTALQLSVGAAQNIPLHLPPGVTATVTSTDSSVLAATLQPGILTVTALGPGVATIVVSSPAQVYMQLTVTVPSPTLLQLSPNPLNLSGFVGTTGIFTASEAGYAGPFTIVSNSDPTIATIMQTSNGVFTATALANGVTTATISNANAQNVSITINSSIIPTAIVLTPAVLAISNVGISATVSAAEMLYSGSFSETSDSSPGIVSVTQSGATFIFTALASGITVITISDTLGHSQTLNIGVTATNLTVM